MTISKSAQLYIVLVSIFVGNVMLAELIGVKIFSLEKLWGIDPLQLELWGQEDLGFNLTTGVLIWPLAFILTDVINEYFGKAGVRRVTYLAVGVVVYAFIVIQLAIAVPPADFWPSAHLWGKTVAEASELKAEVADQNVAFRLIFGQGMWIILGSLVAFIIGQLIDLSVFNWFKRRTGESKLWLRATGSTLVSQLIDSFVVLLIAFYIGNNWPLMQVLAVASINYVYKFVVAILITPLLYLIHGAIDHFLGKDLSLKMRKSALSS